MTNVTYLTSDPTTTSAIFSPNPSQDFGSSSMIVLIITASITGIVIISFAPWGYLYFTPPTPIVPPRSSNRYTTKPSTSRSIRTSNRNSTTNNISRTSWFRCPTSSPVLPLFAQTATDLHLLREVIWETPSDVVAPKVLSKRPQPSRSKSSATSPGTLTSPTFPPSTVVKREKRASAAADPAGMSEEMRANTLFVRRHAHRGTDGVIALALPAIAAGSTSTKASSNPKSKEKAKKDKEKEQKESMTTSPMLSQLKISSPKLPASLAARLAARYHLLSPRTAQAQAGKSGPTVSMTTIANLDSQLAMVNNNGPRSTLRNTQLSHSPPPSSPTVTSTAAASFSVLSPTIARRRIMESGPVEGEVGENLNRPLYTPYRVGAKWGGGSAGLEDVMSPTSEKVHPGTRWKPM